MKQIELWRFRYFDAVRKRYSTTSYLLTEQDARVQFPDGAQQVPGTLEIRRVPENDADFAAASTSAWQGSRPMKSPASMRLVSSLATLAPGAASTKRRIAFADPPCKGIAVPKEQESIMPDGVIDRDS